MKIHATVSHAARLTTHPFERENILASQSVISLIFLCVHINFVDLEGWWTCYLSHLKPRLFQMERILLKINHRSKQDMPFVEMSKNLVKHERWRAWLLRFISKKLQISKITAKLKFQDIGCSTFNRVFSESHYAGTRHERFLLYWLFKHSKQTHMRFIYKHRVL